MGGVRSYKERRYARTANSAGGRRRQVRAVVRLCAPQYPASALEGTGMALAELYCEDLEIPTPDLMKRCGPDIP